MQAFLFFLSLAMGSRLIYILNHASWIINMKQVFMSLWLYLCLRVEFLLSPFQCPPLATAWVYSIVQLNLAPAVASLALVGGWIRYMNLKLVFWCSLGFSSLQFLNNTHINVFHITFPSAAPMLPKLRLHITRYVTSEESSSAMSLQSHPREATRKVSEEMNCVGWWSKRFVICSMIRRLLDSNFASNQHLLRANEGRPLWTSHWSNLKQKTPRLQQLKLAKSKRVLKRWCGVEWNRERSHFVATYVPVPAPCIWRPTGDRQMRTHSGLITK